MGRTLWRALQWLGDTALPPLLLPGAAVVLAGCDLVGGEERGASTLERIRESGELRVLTRNSPTTYYYGRDGETGLEYDLARRFAEELGVDLRIRVVEDISSVFEAMEAGEGHLGAAGITRTPERRERFDFGPAYQQVRQQVVCKRGGEVPKDWEDLPDVDLLVLAGTSYVERLRQIRQVIHDLDWRTTDELSVEQVLLKIRKGEADCTVADSNIVALNQRYYPELVVPFAISEEQELAWALPRGSEELRQRLEEWFAELEEEGVVSALRERYYGHVRLFDYVDIAIFQRRVTDRLPQFLDLFREASKSYPFSWRLLAAQAYQESHWRPDARSPTGVRGMMMLTRRTAVALGIGNRLDLEDSIRGGAEYLNKMYQRLPDSIEEPDRTWIALAAYNVGMGHIRDARRLAERFDRDPDSWSTLKEMLPLLSQEKYYRDLPYGYARGLEPVHYVQRIRQYHAILAKQFDGEDRMARTEGENAAEGEEPTADR
ncbi:MAG: membrane-bound lytic murein transglycosylase MltF [Thiohalorhabdus sp.]|uniref:membrane-bound lytic murein transglycosylase MltF n=1 Tax=Thiohalorhabdus sp. TaxID=3094134 RepID=UPI003980C8E5